MSNICDDGGLKVAILIPARYNSTRFPGKALHLLDGVPMAEHVYRRCESSGIDTFLVSDDERICSLVANSIMTSSHCQNGTERCAEAASQLQQYDAFINVQGDMPDITVEIIHQVAEALKKCELATIYTLMSGEQRQDPNSVKLIHNGERAIWCCRAPLKYGDHHLGVYGYHKRALLSYTSLPTFESEDLEGLEQLRWFSSNWHMNVIEVKFSGQEINTPQDAERWSTLNATRRRGTYDE